MLTQLVSIRPQSMLDSTFGRIVTRCFQLILAKNVLAATNVVAKGAIITTHLDVVNMARPNKIDISGLVV